MTEQELERLAERALAMRSTPGELRSRVVAALPGRRWPWALAAGLAAAVLLAAWWQWPGARGPEKRQERAERPQAPAPLRPAALEAAIPVRLADVSVAVQAGPSGPPAKIIEEGDMIGIEYVPSH